MPTREEHQKQQGLLRDLESRGETAQVQTLRKSWHDHEMALLARDVYAVARGEGKAPTGWMRASEDLDLARRLYPKLAEIATRQLREHLMPRDSGFRAELYLPDSAILGPGYRPVLVPKGSTGLILDSNLPRQADGTMGQRESGAEDFLANNFPQSVGLKTDYYDRIMQLSVRLKESGLEFEFAGHSLAGGMASAGAAVTGYPATTFNAAGLHPETARRFARENAEVEVFEVRHRISAYQVEGEVLNDGIQNNLTRLDKARNAHLAGVLKNVSQLVQEVPQARQWFKQELDELAAAQHLPRYVTRDLHGFVDHLARNDARALLRELPLAAGDVQVLPAMVRRGDRLVERDAQLDLKELTYLAGPALSVANRIAETAQWGKRAGEAVEWAGHLGGRMLDNAGDVSRDGTDRGARTVSTVAQQGGALVGISITGVGNAVAWGHARTGELGACIDRAQGFAHAKGNAVVADGLRWLGDWAPGVLSDELNRQADAMERAGRQAWQRNIQEAEESLRWGNESAGEWRADARTAGGAVSASATFLAQRQHRILATSGRALDATLDVAGEDVRRRSAQAPAAGATLGAGTGGAIGMASISRTDLLRTMLLLRQADVGAVEATERHSMDTMLPSLEARIGQQQAEAQRRLQTAPAPVQSQEGLGTKTPQFFPRSPLDDYLDAYCDAIVRKDDAACRQMSRLWEQTPVAQHWLQLGREAHHVERYAEPYRQAEWHYSAGPPPQEQNSHEPARTHGRSM